MVSTTDTKNKCILFVRIYWLFYSVYTNLYTYIKYVNVYVYTYRHIFFFCVTFLPLAYNCKLCIFLCFVFVVNVYTTTSTLNIHERIEDINMYL